MQRLVAISLTLLSLAGAATANALPKVNPANRMLNVAIDDYQYDRAVGCRKAPQAGTLALQSWLQHNAQGVSWGIMRCSKLGTDNYSLHAEGRALDWHLDAGNAGQRHAANRLIKLLLATDKRGNEHALARRMGIQEIIFNCESWWAGAQRMGPYSQCYDAKGKKLKHPDYTLAHKDHIHFGLSWRGARKHTSFWER